MKDGGKVARLPAGKLRSSCILKMEYFCCGEVASVVVPPPSQ